jgi:Secretion system C-terminal sorting domain
VDKHVEIKRLFLHLLLLKNTCKIINSPNFVKLLKMKFFLTIIILTFMCAQSGAAQTDTVQVGKGQFAISSNTYSFFGTVENSYWWNRSVYIYPKEILKGAARNGARLVGFQLFRDVSRTPNPPTPKIPGRFAANAQATAKIYMANTAIKTWEAVGTWDSVFLVTSMTKVIDEDIKKYIDTLSGWRTFPLTTPFNYDTTKNLAIAVEYRQEVGNVGHIFWAYDSTSIIPGTADTLINRYDDYQFRFSRYFANTPEPVNAFTGKNNNRSQVKFLFRRPNAVEENVLVESMRVFPNPVADLLTVHFTAKDKTRTKMFISDVNGRLFLQKNVDILRGANAVNFPISDVPKGAYLLTIDDGVTIVSQQFIKM